MISLSEVNNNCKNFSKTIEMIRETFYKINEHEYWECIKVLCIPCINKGMHNNSYLKAERQICRQHDFCYISPSSTLEK